ncbi:histidine phosphotransferase family protein [Roseovarius atlanticus]|uniref:histidine phosphotransferase family protein n=1 Tax=Roseovarius atlanticus TaxID=1641875 RepID=UPI001C97C32E|nr:histidine phosphotransferase family protein [Roseovarius atlanticus]MBY5988630.1 histidine phosphotransferase [Roseovarius atlanticus]MBY6124020.1 histidine phosphotransferase [Roseovarius atlanticus]MBY6148515.1 histidine phosphotransferase [Roseovarius atlanticus]
MVSDTNAIAALIGSRICHDLISPIGAVSNGIELLELSGAAASPELALVVDSVAHANARIRFFRLAFGVASPDQETGAEEVNSILHDLHADERTVIDAFPPGHYPRREVRAVLLALLCAEQAVPYGGRITMTLSDEGWLVRATADRMNSDPELWDLLNGTQGTALPAPAHVQFLILPAAAWDARLDCSANLTDEAAEVQLRRA